MQWSKSVKEHKEEIIDILETSSFFTISASHSAKRHRPDYSCRNIGNIIIFPIGYVSQTAQTVSTSHVLRPASRALHMWPQTEWSSQNPNSDICQRRQGWRRGHVMLNPAVFESSSPRWWRYIKHLHSTRCFLAPGPGLMRGPWRAAEQVSPGNRPVFLWQPDVSGGPAAALSSRLMDEAPALGGAGPCVHQDLITGSLHIYTMSNKV